MTKEDVAATIAAYDALIERAVGILTADKKSGFDVGIPYARLSVDGCVATVTWPEPDGEFDDEYRFWLTEESDAFPESLLWLSGQEFHAGLQAWLDDRAAVRVAEAAHQAALEEAFERKQLALLKAKYEGKLND